MAEDLNKQKLELEAQRLYLNRMLLKDEWKSDFPLFARLNLFIVNKQKKRVPFEINHIQMEIERTIARLKAEGKEVKLIILKARQEGVTTYFQGRMIHKCSQKSNANALIVAHRSDSTSTIFEKAKDMNDFLPADIKPLQRASNATELVYHTPTNYKGKEKGLNSKIRVQTAGTAGIGRGDTFDMVHLSEFAFWQGSDENSPKNQLSGILEAIPTGADAELIIESTANGMNDFKDEWDRAVAGESSFTPLFFPWHVHEEYTTDFRSYEEKEKFMANMSPYELWLFNDRKLPLERVHWWHNKLKDKGGDVALMKQENPSTAEEAFIMSGTPVFNNDKVVQRIAILREDYKKNPYKQGYFTWQWNNDKHKDFIKDDTIDFVESDTKNYVRIYEQPITSRPYVIGGDTKGEGTDAYGASVIDNKTHKRVATLQMYVNHSHPYTHQIYALGRFYNNALVGIEINFNTGPIDELDRLDYPNQYQRTRYDSFIKGYQDKYGWKTDRTTRPLIIDNEIKSVEEKISLFTDIPTLQEMLTFMYDSNGRPDAVSGKHDDLLMSDMIANEIKSQQTTGVVIDTEDINIESLPKDYREDYYNAEKKGVERDLLLYWDKIGILEKLRKK